MQYKESHLTEKAVQATSSQFSQKQTELKSSSFPAVSESSSLWETLLVIFGFGVCEDVRLQVGRLSKFLVAAIKGTNIRAVAGVNPHMSAQVKVQREAFSTSFKRALERRDRKEKYTIGSNCIIVFFFILYSCT